MMKSLYSADFFDSSEVKISENELGFFYLDKPVRIVYEGSFNSMDGPVEVTSEVIDRILDKNQDFNKENLSLCPPIQLDHSTSAERTVGRLIGPLSVSENDGKKTLFGVARILGKENIEKVIDGRWIHLSIGADFESGKIEELTITPFPAASNASFLAKGKNMSKKEDEEDKGKVEMSESEDEEKKELSEKEEDKGKVEMSESEDEDEKVEMSESESEDEDDEEEEKEEKKEMKKSKKLSSKLIFNSEIKKLSQEFKNSFDDFEKQMVKKSTIARLSQLKAQGKITPAEYKKLGVEDLVLQSKETIDWALKSFESRQPVVHMGQFGSSQKIDMDYEVKKDIKDLKAEESKEFYRLALFGKKMQEQPEKVEIHVDTTPHEENEYLGDEYVAACKMIDEGKKDDLKKFLKTWHGKKDKMSEDEKDADEKVKSAVKKMSSIFVSLENLMKGIK